MLPKARAKRVLVTGAGGWLGGELAGLLAERGWEVTALVRRRAEVLRNDASAAAIARQVRGDISLPRFGWDEGTWREVARSHGLVVHCAALTQFGAQEARLHRVNVGGTAEVLRLVAAGRSGLLHLSTAYVNGARSDRVAEDEPPNGPFTNAYEASKAEAEALVRSGPVPFVVARPGIVLGDWAQGRVREFSTFYLLLKTLAEGRVRTMPTAPAATLDLVPVDHVTGGIADLADRFGAASGGTFHLVSGAPTPVPAIPATLSRFRGLCAPALVRSGAFDPSAGARAEARRFARLLAPYAPYFSRAPVFDDSEFRALTGRACPEVGPGWWSRLIEFALRAGFLTPRAPAAAPGALPAA